MNQAIPKTVVLVLLAFIAATAFALRDRHLDRPSFWEDDYLGLDRALMEQQRVFALQKFQGPSRTSYDFQPPLYYALVHAALAIDDSPAGAKMTSVLAGTLAALAFFLLGRTLYDDKAGLFAALLCALNLSHIAASQGIKAYALFHLLCAASFAFLWRALKKGGGGDWTLFSLSGLCLVYTSYIGLPLLGGQMLLAGGYLLLRKINDQDIHSVLWRAAAAFAVILAGFSPYLEGVFFFRDFMTDQATFAFTRIPADSWPGLLSGFLFYEFEAGAFWWTAVLISAALGVAGFITKKEAAPLFLTLLAIGAPVGAALMSRSSHPLEYRHFAPLFLPAILLPACGLAFVSERLSRMIAKPLGAYAGLAAGLALACLLSLPSLSGLGQFYRTSLSYDKAVFSDLAANKNNIGYLEFAEYQAETRRLGAGWFLKGLYKDLSGYAPFPYKRVYLAHNYLSGESAFHPGPYAHLKTAFSTSIFHTDIYALGLVNRSPLVMTARGGRFVYEEGFDSLRLFNDCARAENVFPELGAGMLKATDPTKPASLEYAFLIPKGVDAKEIALTVDAALYKRSPKWAADSRVLISASADGGPFEEVLRIGFADFFDALDRYEPKQCPQFLVSFNSRCGRFERTMQLFENAAPKQFLRIRFTLETGQREGHLVLDAFRLEAKTNSVAQEHAALQTAFANVLRNVRSVKWDSGKELAFGDGLYAFDLTGALGCETGDAPCNPGGDLASYEATHKGAKPVYVLPGPGGGQAAAFYDPSLDDPFVQLSKARPSAIVDRNEQAAMHVKSVKIVGAVDLPSFTADGQKIDVPVYAPKGSTLVLNAGGEGRLFIHPRFTEKDYAPEGFLNSYNIARNGNPGEDGCLTCREDYKCFFTYSVISAFPITELLMENHMRVFMDPEGKNSVRALVSVGESEDFKPIEELVSDGSGTWKGNEGFARAVRFEKPVPSIKIRYELTGQGAQLWSTDRPIDDMRLSLRLDARSFAPFSIKNNPFTLSSQNPGETRTGYFFSPDPAPFFDALRLVE